MELILQEDLDAGAIITQEAVEVKINDTEEELIERIKRAEHEAFPRALQMLATAKVKLGDDNKIIWN